MKHIEGYVCVGVSEEFGRKRQILFGQVQDFTFEARGFESFASSLTPFDTLENARQALENIRQELSKTFSQLKIGHIELNVAESPEELLQDQTLLNSKSLIVIWHNDAGAQLIGRYVEGAPNLGTLPGAYLSDNGMKPVLDHEKAMYYRWQISRQSGCSKTTLATFSFKWVR